jgi:alkanesulfonate monooxygenase SsuD/methylene tetrahydromethanopterin reductase-like flavin-dependent oxidoreductase (luciferase family)
MRLSIPIAIGALVASCSTPAPNTTSASEPAPSTAAAPAPGVSYAEDLVTYVGRLRAMNETALGAEAARMKRDQSDVARVKAALALSLSPQIDDSEVIDLVEPVTRKPAANADVKAMASFVHAMAMERRRLKQRATAAAGELREERRLSGTQAQRAEQLQQKLDALTNLEKSLAERETKTR